jgi:hypothetical protein
MSRLSSDGKPSFGASLGLLASAIATELGRVIAVVGALIVAFACPQLLFSH